MEKLYSKYKIAWLPRKCTNCNNIMWLEEYLKEEWLIEKYNRPLKGNICMKCLILR